MQIVDLAQQPWQLSGDRPFFWLLRRHSAGPQFAPEVGPVPVRIPSSAQQALLDAGLIQDWNVALNSNLCEWVEHRHWQFSTTLKPVPAGTPVVLAADGLDYAGWIAVDNTPIAEFEGSALRHRFDLTAALADGKEHTLRIIFEQAPHEQGQIGFTSRSRHFKPRYAYSWDWAPRFVPVGIWDNLRLEIGPRAGEIRRVLTTASDDLKSGRSFVVLNCLDPRYHHARLALRDSAGNDVASSRLELKTGENHLVLDAPKVKLWWPNGHGEQPLYTLSISLESDSGTQHLGDRTVGFKRVRWLACEGAPPEADPWICEVNGKPIFLQGANWTPVRVDYMTVTRDDYARVINLYRDMGANTLRVWGGAFVEKEDFYDICDRAGLLVWQEFPLSSSGFDSCAPDDPAAIKTLARIASDYISRRGHHASKLMWCGGNELQGDKDKIGGRPNDLSNPVLAAMHAVVRREDPLTRFVATSPSGPSFAAEPQNFGKGVHWDTHGPWAISGSLDDWRRYWAGNDSLFCSECGVPGASSMQILEQYKGSFSVFPPDRSNPYWVHSAGWWLQWDRYKDQLKGLPQDQVMPRYVELSQAEQAEGLAIVASSMKAKFPRCGGLLIWMGHDCFPCPANTAFIDFHYHSKPAYHALAKIFKQQQ